MAQSKNIKRKRRADARIHGPEKLAKVSPPLEAAISSAQPTSLFSVTSNEELEIATDTLATLAQHPGLTKSKLCKALRNAVYDFRQSCTIGANAADGANLTARISAAITDERFLDARILLSEMRLRGQEPKLGALCRWVRDLDVVTQASDDGTAVTKRSIRDLELLSVLDAVLRVSSPTDLGAIEPMTDLSTPISRQAPWDLRPDTAPHQVYASVLDGSILSLAPSLPLSSIETTPGHLRKPPNRHPAILYTTAPNAVRLSAEPQDVTLHSHPCVPSLSLATNVVSPDECKAIIAAGESVGFIPDIPIREGDSTSVLAHNFYWIVDKDFHDALWARLSPHVPSVVDGRRVRGLNRRFRVYRYTLGSEYRCHIDGAWPPSGIGPDNKYIYDDSPADAKQSSLFTFLLYLNDEFTGGETTFFLPSQREGLMNAYPVRPVIGGVAIFPHGETKGALLHEGTGVTQGAKYIVRSDIEYDVAPGTGE